MAYNKKEAQAKIQALGDAMAAHKYDEAWTVAGALSSYLKTNKDSMTGSDFEIINRVIKEYYAMNKQIEAVGKRVFAMGKKTQAVQL
ncbi:hypothetical protein [Lactococcus protaetiae]|uniref:Uncharacterized protein n=1 Tax=Lactococcus protaetiae TaxID=2592653 RepID=A0A514Z6F2_9LACT|nr:hypothetical protein [Lactococcus protaetiae]QDK70156.1 hypothetical protein FLP15_01905 [Lactococcus protaetiae]